MSAQPARRLRAWGAIAGISLATSMAAMSPMAPAFAADPAAWQIDTVEPRAYGHSIGDLVQRRVVVRVPAGYALNEETLPTAGRRGGPIELRRLTRETCDETSAIAMPGLAAMGATALLDSLRDRLPVKTRGWKVVNGQQGYKVLEYKHLSLLDI